MKYIIKVEAEFGSDFQEQSGLGAVMAMLEGWKMFYSDKHKKNKLNYKIEKISK